MKRLESPRTLALAVALGASALLRAATFTLDDASPILVRPPAGSVTYDFTGTFAFDADEFPVTYGNSAAFTLAGDGLSPVPNDAAFSRFRDPGASFAGTLFRVTIDAATPLGVYDRFNGPSEPPVFLVGYRDGAITAPITEIRLPYSITVQAVPEPATMAALGLGALVVLRRRRRA